MWEELWGRLLRWLHESDKLQHIIVSLVLFQGFALSLSPVEASVAAFMIGILKEVWDAVYGAGFSWGDILANALGIALGAALLAPWLT